MTDEIEFEGARIALRAVGRGQTIIAVHCSSSHSGQWKPLMEELGGRYRIIAPDLHGYGRSDPLPEDGRPWFAHDVALLRRLIAEAAGPVHLVGHSLGAAACFMAARDRDDVASLWLYEPVLFALLDEAGVPEASDAWWIASRVHGLLRLGRRSEAAECFVDFWSGEGAWEATDNRIRNYVVQTIDRVADDWAGILGNLEGQAGIADAARIGAPVRLLRGTDTRPSARRIVDILHGALTNSELIELQGVGHMAPAIQPHAILPHITGWLEARSVRGQK